MQNFLNYVYNPFLLTGLLSWIIAQFLKLVIHTIIYKKFEISRLFGDGGMPSGHSATVVSLATVTALGCGVSSFEFAVTAILAIIVCHDAMGVRRETGKQAVIINEIIESFNVFATEKLPETKLKEFVGHTPIQVLSGALIGIANAVIMYFILF